MIAAPPDVKIGQHILCPHCSTKFSFSLGATMHIPTIDLSFLSRASLTIKCEVCGEYIEVDDKIVIGNDMWAARDDKARMNRLRRDVSELQCIQGVIDDLALADFPNHS